MPQCRTPSVLGAVGAGPINLEGERNANERCRNEVLRGVRDGQRLGRLQGILPPERDLHGAGRAPGGREDARDVLRLDEGPARLHAGRSIRAKAWGVDEQRKNVSAYGVFHATHTGQGGPCPPTGRQTKTDYVYVMQFEADKIKHMQKIWHAGLAMKELGWI